MKNKAFYIYIFFSILIFAMLFSPVKSFLNSYTEEETPPPSISSEELKIELKNITNSKKINLHDSKGKVILLNFWGTWCPPCVEEFPSLQKLYETYHNHMEFILIPMQDKTEKVQSFLTKNQYTIPVYEAQSPIAQNLLPKVFPTTYLISKQGKIVLKIEGAEDWNSPKIHQKIIQLLN